MLGWLICIIIELGGSYGGMSWRFYRLEPVGIGIGLDGVAIGLVNRQLVLSRVCVEKVCRVVLSVPMPIDGRCCHVG